MPDLESSLKIICATHNSGSLILYEVCLILFHRMCALARDTFDFKGWDGAMLYILDAADALLRKNGNFDLSLTEFAKHVGLEPIAVTRAFKTKNDLLLAVRDGYGRATVRKDVPQRNAGPCRV